MMHANTSKRDLDRVVMIARSVEETTGKLLEGDGCSVNWTPVPVWAGSRLSFPEGSPLHRVFFYGDREDEELSATYSYDEESNWTAYMPGLSEDGWSNTDWTAPRCGYVRVAFQTDTHGTERLGNLLRIEGGTCEHATWRESFEAECDRVVERVEAMREPGDCTFFLLSDVHHAVGDCWIDTAQSLRTCAERLRPNAVLQLGDVTDGIAPRAVTEQLVLEVLEPLRDMDAPLLGCIGNHDANYFRGNRDMMDAASCSQLYLDRDDPDYCFDVPRARLRLLFLHSFDPNRKDRYGYSDACVKWLRRTLRQTPRGWRVLVFSHVPPKAAYHFWSERIENETAVISTLERFHRKHDGGVLGFVHGHSHADQVYGAQGFPIVSVGCAKYEYFQEKKPEGSFTPARRQGDPSQMLWDVLVVKPAAKRMEFVRFGAGYDRSTRTW